MLGLAPSTTNACDPAWLAGEQAKQRLAEFIYEQIRYRRRQPGSDLISQLVQSDVGRSLSEEALMMNVRQLLFGGSETTQKWLGHIVVTLSRMPELRRELLHNRALLPAAFWRKSCDGKQWYKRTRAP